MFNIFLFLSLSFFFIFVVGHFLQKIRIPWVFAALLLGAGLAAYNPVSEITSSEQFIFLAQLGMYFLLFMIGLELDLGEIKKKKKFIFTATFFIIFLEGVAGTFLIHFVFHYSWIVSFLVALSFATVGEAILIPILEEFKIVNTKLGQAIISIGTIDDLLEMLVLILVTVFIGTQSSSGVFMILGSLLLLFLLTVGFKKLKNKGEEFSYKNVKTLFFFVILTFLFFVGIGSIAHAGPIAALLAGIALRTFIPAKRLISIDSEVKNMAYGFFVPIFFLWVGVTMDYGSIIAYPLAILAVVLVSKSMKLLGAYIVGRKELGKKQSILLGIGLSVRFSTSIVIIKLLLDSGMIDIKLYSIIIASSIAFKFIVPLLFSFLLNRWDIGRKMAINPLLK